jgi:hypothetical protein
MLSQQPSASIQLQLKTRRAFNTVWASQDLRLCARRRLSVAFPPIGLRRAGRSCRLEVAAGGYLARRLSKLIAFFRFTV